MLGLRTETSTTPSNQDYIVTIRRIGETKPLKIEKRVLYHDVDDLTCVPDLGTALSIQKHEDQAQVTRILDCKFQEATKAGCLPAVADHLHFMMLDMIDCFCLHIVPSQPVEVAALEVRLKNSTSLIKCNARSYPK